MKTISRLIWILALAFIGSASLVSCGDDDDDDDLDGGASKIAGTYSGALTATVNVMGQAVECNFDGTYDMSILREKNTDDDVTVVLPACSFATPGMQTAQTIPAIHVEDVDVERSLTDVNTYLIDEDNFSVMIDNVVYSGSIKGKVIGSSINVNYALKPGAMPMYINFTYTGTLK